MIIDIRNKDDKHLGFILFAVQTTNNEKATGDCVVRALPREHQLFDTSEYEFLGNLQDFGEFQFEHDKVNNIISINSASPALRFFVHDGDKCVDSISGLEIFGILVNK